MVNQFIYFLIHASQQSFQINLVLEVIPMQSRAFPWATLRCALGAELERNRESQFIPIPADLRLLRERSMSQAAPASSTLASA